MVLSAFEWAASTSAANLTREQVQIICNATNSFVDSSLRQNLVHSVAGVGDVPLNAKPPAFLVWTIGIFFVTIINMCAVVGIGVMRYLSKNVYNQIITLFVGLGVGSLSGSSLYHLLPQANPILLEETDEFNNPTYSHLHMAHFAIVGVYAFFFCDKLIKIILEARKRSRAGHENRHERFHGENGGLETGRSEGPLLQKSNAIENNSEEVLRNVVQNHKGGMSMAECHETEMMNLANKSGKSMGDQAHGICVHDHSMQFRAGDSAIAAVAWMIIFGDGLHNFIDGISIGASFAESIHSGVSVSLAVLCEEFPHELGDVAILVASGMTLRQALLYNLLSAITCYVGFLIGVAIGELGPEVSKYAFGLAGGMFLYIALACMMPEMKKAMEEALNVSLCHGVYVLFLQSVGLFIGLTLMYLMARYGESIAI